MPIVSTTNSLASVVTKNQGFMSNEISDTFDSHLDLNGFCTVDNSLQGVPGDIRTINVYGASGTAVDVAEGYGNDSSIATTLVSKDYQIKCAQAWFRYSDEALMRDPVAVQTGITHLGTALFNKVNADIFTEMGKAEIGVSAATPNFDAFVDAVASLTIKDAAGEDALDAQRRFVPTVFALASKGDIAKIRKACKDQIEYVPEHAWTPGYVGEVAGVTLFYKQNMTNGNIVVGTREAVTVFNKSGVDFEVAARSGGTTGTANLRFNDNYARKYYIAALTDLSQICQLVLPGGVLPYTQSYTATASQTAFALSHDATEILRVTVDGVDVTWTWAASDPDAVTLAAVGEGKTVNITYKYVVSA